MEDNNTHIIKAIFEIPFEINEELLLKSFGKYNITKFLSENGNPNNNLYCLSFPDDLGVIGRSNPVQEVKQVLTILSFIIGKDIKYHRTLHEDIQIDPFVYPEGYLKPNKISVVNFSDFKDVFQRFNSLNIDIAKQLMRAINVYQTAQSVFYANSTLCFFLLTVAIECLSNQIKSNQSKCNKFTEFVIMHCDFINPKIKEESFRELLKEIYTRHRSGFTHGGKEVPEASNVADSSNFPYLENIINGKLVKTPGLKWFNTIVRNVLLNYIHKLPNDTTELKDIIKQISLEYGIITVRIAK